MGLACNMLTAVGGTPAIVTGYQAINYPGPLPGGVRPELTVFLSGLSTDSLKMFMQIEYPENGPVALDLEGSFPTIGAFYEAISEAFQRLNPPISTHNQLISPGVGLTQVKNVADATDAIEKIKEQGEGTTQSPDAIDFGGNLSHYYRFAEILHQHRFVQHEDGWRYDGDTIPFPDVYAMPSVPAGGYVNPSSSTKQTLQAFNQQFASVLTNLQSAWTSASQQQLSVAVRAMLGLQGLASTLLQIPLPDGTGVYGPEFRLS